MLCRCCHFDTWWLCFDLLDAVVLSVCCRLAVNQDFTNPDPTIQTLLLPLQSTQPDERTANNLLQIQTNLSSSHHLSLIPLTTTSQQQKSVHKTNQAAVILRKPLPRLQQTKTKLKEKTQQNTTLRTHP